MSNMTGIRKYIARIQKAISELEKYEDYVPILEEYKKYLKIRLLQNTKDIDAACQLASVYNELRYDTEKCVRLLQNVLKICGDDLNIIEKSRILTNLAFYYGEELNNIENCTQYLREAIDLGTQNPNAYDALAWIYYKNSRYKETISYCKQACLFSDGGDLKYKYNLAASFYQNNQLAEAKSIFEELANNYKYERRVFYGLAVCSFYLGDKSKTLKIADQLANEEYDDYIDEGQLAELYFLLECFEKHNAIYDEASCQYCPSVSWISPYFYSLYKLGKTDKLSNKFVDIMQEKNKNIAEVEDTELEEAFTQEDKNTYIQQLKQEKEKIELAYNDIVVRNKKPNIHINLSYMYSCYLIDCVRHQKI